MSFQIQFKSEFEGFTLDVDINIPNHSNIALMGPSGSGKTVLLRWLAGFDRQGQGSFILNGKQIKELPPEEREFGIVTQEPVIFENLTVLENIGLGLRARGISKSEKMNRVKFWLKVVGLEHLINRDPGMLSGGEIQRIAFLRATVWNPKLLLMDEPVSALDPEAKRAVYNTFQQIQKQGFSVPLVLVTHSLDEAKGFGVEHIFKFRTSLENGRQVRRLVCEN